MQWLTGFHDANLADWEDRPFSVGVLNGPRPHDHRDNHERLVGRESAGPPEPNGVASRLGQAILRFDVFPPALLTSVVRRSPV